MRKHELAKLEAISDKLPMIFIHPNGRMYEQADTGMGYEIMRGVEPANLANRLYRLKVVLDEILAHTVTEPLTEKPVKEEKPQPKATPSPKKEKPARGHTEANLAPMEKLVDEGKHEPYTMENETQGTEDGTKGQKMAKCPKGGPAAGDELALSFCKPKKCFEECEAWKT